MLIKTELTSLQNNVFNLIGKQWMLVTAGNLEKFNTMTASWGGLGVLWNRNVATIYIRPQRYTLEFIESNDQFTLCFFNEVYKDILRYCGAHSGRDVDKVAQTGITPLRTSNGNVVFQDSFLVLECKKIYADRFKEKLIGDKLVKSLIYPSDDYHHIFIGEIINCMVQK